jgi:predicted SprT family Zn-dependent metalloprotease
MIPGHVSVNLKFDRDIKGESDGYMRPIYYPDGRVQFDVVFNTDLIEANLNNLDSNGMKGLVVHELAHIYDFLVDPKGFAKYPHQNKTFTTTLSKVTKSKRGSPVYRATMQPDVSTACALRGCKNKIAPAWLSNYWLYFCKDCGYYDSYVTDLRAKVPVCERCGSHNLIQKKIPVALAAKMDQSVTKNPKSFDTDGEIKKYIMKELKQTISKNQLADLATSIKRISKNQRNKK